MPPRMSIAERNRLRNLPAATTDKETPMPAFAAATTVLDSVLFRDAFGTPAMREVFSDVALVARYAEVEVALAKAEAKCGVIPQQAADEIAARTDVAKLDFDLLRQETDIVGYPILPLVHQDGEAVRRGRPLRALGCDHAGYHGHRRGAAAPRRPRRSSRTTSPRCAASSQALDAIS